MDSNYIRSLCVSVDFYEATFKHFPILRERSDYQKFFWYLCLGAQFDKDYGKLLLCKNAVAALLDKEPRNFVAVNFFEKFRRDVVGKGNFLWHKPYIKRCRMLARLDLGEFNDILDAELAGHFYGYRPVYLDGSRHTAAKARKARAAEKGIANSRPGFGSEALFIQKYLNSLPRNLFFTNFVSNHQRALRFVIENFRGKERQRELRILRRITCQLQPFYGASSKENTVRLFSSAHIPQLKRAVRKVYTGDWSEADLKCAQLAICARLWEVPSVLEFLYSGQNIWKHFCKEMGIPEPQWEPSKRPLKEAVYSLTFVMEPVRIRSLLARNLSRNGVHRTFARRFLSIPLIKDVLIARDKAVAQVVANGGAEKCYGKFLQITKELQPRDILAQVAQSYEMKLIYPPFELAADNPDFRILSYQFDGFTAQFTRRDREWKAKMKAAVDKRAEEYEMPTYLEWDEGLAANSRGPFAPRYNEVLHETTSY